METQYFAEESMRVLVPLAEGFEEIEAVNPAFLCKTS